MGEIFLIKDDGKLVQMKEEKYDSEDLLQELLEKYPNLLAGDQMDSKSPRRWLLISREMGVPDEEEGGDRWSLDHLFLDQDGIPTLVEVKRSTDTRIRREVVGQMLDYAANAMEHWPIETIQAKFEARCAREEKDAQRLLGEFLNDTTRQVEFWQMVKTNLQAGKIRLVFVADEVPSELRRVVEFLNSQMDPAVVIAVEISQYAGEGLKTLVPRVIGQTEEAQQKKSGGIREPRKWDEDSFFGDLISKRGTEECDAARKILEWARAREVNISWGKGQQTGSFVPTLISPKGIQYMLFAVFTSGTVQIYFGLLKTRPEFQSESRRIELLTKLNGIPGVSIPPDGINRYPSIPLSVFTKEAPLKQFMEVFDWFLGEITS